MPESPPPPVVPSCGICGAPVRASLGAGQCPRCLLGLGSNPDFSGEDPIHGELLPDLMQMRVFGDYDLVEELARGGMGIVYRAWQRSLQREVALKMILAGDLATAEAVQRFRQEAQTAARLDHPNIVSVYEIGDYQTQPYFSMRLVGGRRNIADWARALPDDAGRSRRIALMMARVARTIGFAHERGVVHRDLKPSNILLDENDEPQVTDFGLAKWFSGGSSVNTMSFSLLGSPSYMAPEQAEGRHGDVTTLTDVYGLGAVLYEMLSGRPPFMGRSAVDTLRRVLEGSPAPLKGVPRNLATVCLKCLSRKPADRYSSATTLAADLERFARGEPVRALPQAPALQLWMWARRRPAVASLLGSLVLAFVVGFAGVAWQWKRAEQAGAKLEKSLHHLVWREIVREAESGAAPLALARLAKELRADPDKWQASMLAMSIVEQHAFPVLAGPMVALHPPPVLPPRLAPDGSWFAAATADQSLSLWDTATGREFRRIPMDAPVTALAAGSGTIALAVATADGRLRITRSPGGPLEEILQLPSGPALSLQLSSNGAHLAAVTKTNIILWNSGSPASAARVLTLEGGVQGGVLAASGARIFAWNKRVAGVWDTESGASLLTVKALSRFVKGALSADGGVISLIDGEFSARSWQVASGQSLAGVLSPLTSYRQIALNTDGSRVGLGGLSNDLEIYDTRSGLVISPVMRHLYDPTALTASPDGKVMASQATDGRTCLWDAWTGKAKLIPIALDTLEDMTMDLTTGGESILVATAATAGSPARIGVWQSSRPRSGVRREFPGQRDFNGSRISPDGRLGCLGLYPGNRACVYELATGRVLLDQQTAGNVYVHLFSPDMKKYYALTANGWRYGWDLASGQPLWPPDRQPGAIRPGTITQDGSRILAGHNDGHVRIYDTATGALVRALAHPGEVKSVRLAPDGRGRFISASTDNLAHVWDLHSWKKLCTLSGHTATILATAWSPDSRLVATASYDKTARIWDSVTGRQLVPPLLHGAWLSHLEFSPDGRTLATACRDGNVRLWDPHTGQPLSAPLPQGDTAETVRFTPDGECFLVRDQSGFRFWDTATAEPVTIHYHDPVSCGLGMDSESWRSMIGPDGTQVFLGAAMNAGALWHVAQPRHPAPAWFPDFLERLAQVRMDSHDAAQLLLPEELRPILRQAEASPGADTFLEWATSLLPEPLPAR